MDLSVVRRTWQLLETVHLVVYFAPEKKRLYDEAGLRGGWMGYFASRAAALGAVEPDPVAALFYNFHPAMVRRALPDAWRFSSPQRVLQARYDVADAALTRLLGSWLHDPAVEEAVRLVRALADGCHVEGRPLFAAHSAVPWPDLPHLQLWHGATLVREFRGDGHIVALTAGGLDGCEAHVSFAAGGAVPREVLQSSRGWSDVEWTAAEDRLRDRGLLDDEGRLTREGGALRAWVEKETDRLSAAAFERLGEEKVGRLAALLEAPVRLIVEAGGVPFPNPAGLPSPLG